MVIVDDTTWHEMKFVGCDLSACQKVTTGSYLAANLSNLLKLTENCQS